jgi:Xanthomonas XOO_2897-like deaminase
MTRIQQFKQFLSPFGRLAFIAIFLLSIQPALESAQAGSSPQPIPFEQEAPTQRGQLRQMNLGKSDLENCIKLYRLKYAPSSGTNVACFEYEENGQLRTIAVAAVSSLSKGEKKAIFSYRDRTGREINQLVVKDAIEENGLHSVSGKHAEELIDRQLQRDGVQLNQITKGHTEYGPCDLPGHNCRDLVIKKMLDAGITITYTWPYADLDKKGRRASVGANKKDAEMIKAAGKLFEKDPEGKVLGALNEQFQSLSGGDAKSAPGGIDFSTLELRYIAEDSSPFADRGLRYAFNATPATGNKNLNAGRTAAVQASDAFFVWLSLTPNKFWVNLNPNEPNRILDSQFGKTDAGRILLQADLRMKKTVAQLIHPDTSLGQQFWQQLGKNGTQTCLSFRQWIVPAPATIREDGNGIYIQDAPLQVKLESQYFKSKGLSGFLASCPSLDKSTKAHNESVFRTLILPRIEQAVNKAPEYAELRRVYRSRVAAEWYRQRSTSQATAYREMVNHGDITSWPARQDWSPRRVFDQYVNSYKKGEFHVVRKWREGNYIYGKIYLFGGVDFTKVFFKKLNSAAFQEKWGNLPQVVDTSMKSPVADRHGKIWLGGSSTTPDSKSIWKSWFYLVPGALVVLFLIHRKYTMRRA